MGSDSTTTPETDNSTPLARTPARTRERAHNRANRASTTARRVRERDGLRAGPVTFHESMWAQLACAVENMNRIKRNTN